MVIEYRSRRNMIIYFSTFLNQKLLLNLSTNLPHIFKAPINPFSSWTTSVAKYIFVQRGFNIYLKKGLKEIENNFPLPESNPGRLGKTRNPNRYTILDFVLCVICKSMIILESTLFVSNFLLLQTELYLCFPIGECFPAHSFRASLRVSFFHPLPELIKMNSPEML